MRVNGDGKSDLEVANGNSDNVSILLGNGNGTFAALCPPAAGSSPKQGIRSLLVRSEQAELLANPDQFTRGVFSHL